jgi:hypothetical protein
VWREEHPHPPQAAGVGIRLKRDRRARNNADSPHFREARP